MIYNSNCIEKLRKDFGNSKAKTANVALFLSSLSGAKKLLKKCLPCGDTEKNYSYKFLNVKLKVLMFWIFIWMFSNFFTSIYFL